VRKLRHGCAAKPNQTQTEPRCWTRTQARKQQMKQARLVHSAAGFKLVSNAHQVHQAFTTFPRGLSLPSAVIETSAQNHLSLVPSGERNEKKICTIMMSCQLWNRGWSKPLPEARCSKSTDALVKSRSGTFGIQTPHRRMKSLPHRPAAWAKRGY
jgi:hypothetical protein